MIIKHNSLWGYLYLLNFELSLEPYVPRYTNLCHFMRVIVLWLPLKFVSVAALITFAVVWVEVALLSLLVLAAFAAGTLLTVGILFGCMWLSNHTLAAQYISAKKSKICPFVEIH